MISGDVFRRLGKAVDGVDAEQRQAIEIIARAFFGDVTAPWYSASRASSISLSSTSVMLTIQVTLNPL